jgi:hypothetical protein
MRPDNFLRGQRAPVKRLQIIFFVLIAMIIIAAFVVQGLAFYNCGWSSYLVFGRQLNWAYLSGYCGG